jgi:antitoxin HicB
MFDASYPASFLPEKDGSGFHVRFRDLPEALTGAASLDQAKLDAEDCLAEAIAGRIDRGDSIPQPSKARSGESPIGVPLYLAPKLALYLAMRERGMRNTELAARLAVSETVIRRMLNPRHHTKPVVTFKDAA